MKFVFSVALFLLSISAFSQPYGIKINVDEFTNDSTLVSDWQTVNDPTWKGGQVCYVRIISTKDAAGLQFKTTTSNRVLSINEGNELMIKTKEGVLTLRNNKFTIAEKGGGAKGLRASGVLGLNLLFLMDDDALLALGGSEIEKLRLVTNEGNLEIEPEKRKWTKNLIEFFSFYRSFAQKMGY